MRLYKFRAWDKQKKEWIDMTHMNISFKTDKTMPGKWYAVKHIDGKTIINKQMITMQYTGLHDDLGDEICEGDVCYAFKKSSGLNGYYRVTWDEIRGRWAYMSGSVCERYQVGKAGNMHCKIVGNQFDTPALDNIWKHH